MNYRYRIPKKIVIKDFVNGCPKSICLGNTFRNFGGKEKKKRFFFDNFYSFP